jgi:hypothetical protein
MNNSEIERIRRQIYRAADPELYRDIQERTYTLTEMEQAKDEAQAKGYHLAQIELVSHISRARNDNCQCEPCKIVREVIEQRITELIAPLKECITILTILINESESQW